MKRHANENHPDRDQPPEKADAKEATEMPAKMQLLFNVMVDNNVIEFQKDILKRVQALEADALAKTMNAPSVRESSDSAQDRTNSSLQAAPDAEMQAAISRVMQRIVLLEAKALDDYQANLKLTAEKQVQEAVVEKDRLIEEAKEQRKEAEMLRENQYSEIHS